MLSIKQTTRLNTLVTRLMVQSRKVEAWALHLDANDIEKAAIASANSELEKTLRQYHAFIAKLQEPKVLKGKYVNTAF